MKKHSRGRMCDRGMLQTIYMVAAAWFNPLAGWQPCLAHAAAAAAQSRQLCQPLCNPRYCSLPGSPAHGIFSARILE